MIPIGRSNDTTLPIIVNPLSFPLSIITSVLVYLPVLLPKQLDVTSNGWNIVSIIFCFITIIIVYGAFFMFLRSIINNEYTYTPIGLLYGIVDSIYSLFHALSCIAFVIILIRGNTTTDFKGIPATSFGYELFWTYCLSNSVSFFLSAGSANIIPLTGWSVLWSMGCSITGIIALGIVLAITMSKLQKRKRIPPQSDIRILYRQSNKK